MSRIAALALALLASGLGAAPAFAGPRPEVDVPALVRGSDMIVVGRVRSTNFAGTPAAATERFSLSVDRTLKGRSTGAPFAVAARLDLSGDGYEPVADRQYGIFFLQIKAGDAVFSAVDAFHPAVVASPQDRSGVAASGQPLNDVARELATVLTTPPAILTNPVYGAQRLVSRVEIPREASDPGAASELRVLRGSLVQAQVVYEDAARALATVPYDIAGEQLRPLTGAHSVLTRLWAVNCLISMGVTRDLALVAPDLVNPSPDLAYTVHAFAIGLRNVDSPELIPALTDLLGSTSVSIRRAAAAALYRIANAAVIQPLATIALDDLDQEVRFYAVSGLSRAAGIGEEPALSIFRKDESKYIMFWRRWLSANGSR
jgi:hypothetical protein